MNRRFAKSQSLLRCFVPCALPLVAANCALAPEERGHDDTFGETIAPLTAEQFYDTWKVQVNVGDGVYVNLSPSLEAEYSSQFFPTTDYTGLMMTIWNEDEALSGNRKPRVEPDELNGWERDIIVAQAHTDGTFDSGGSTDALAAAVVYRASSGGLECKVSSPSGEVYTSLQPSVVFGTYYKLRVEVNDAQARCAIAVAANSVWSYTPYAATQPGRMYFKTGNYTQPPLATAGTTGRTRVRIKGFATTH
jgi:hypothetical protein